MPVCKIKKKGQDQASDSGGAELERVCIIFSFGNFFFVCVCVCLGSFPFFLFLLCIPHLLPTFFFFVLLYVHTCLFVMASKKKSSISTTENSSASIVPTNAEEIVDVLIVGAGLSGVDAGMHLSKECPDLRYVILEGRESMGGTWDLFRYPGIRSDSDMFTLGFGLKPWTKAKTLADGPSILEYIKEAAREFRVEEHIRLNHRVVRAEWDSEQGLWTVLVHKGSNGSGGMEKAVFLTRFLFVCSGYYNYEHGNCPDFPGIDKFTGQVVHPQKWDVDLDYTGKQVVIIGSGATAVTLLPAMADKAAHVTMLQRSPTYVASLPPVDFVGRWLMSILPITLAYTLVRWKNMLIGLFFYNLARTFPNFMKGLLRKGVQKFFGDDSKMLASFQPRYNPWEQRLCFMPDADLFRAIRQGQASVVTGLIETFTPTGIRLTSGQELPADVVVTATGLELLAMGGIQFVVDKQEVRLGEKISYRGAMISDMPNFAYILGYLNASWTLKADLSCQFVVRLLKEMRTKSARKVVPSLLPGEKLALKAWATDFSSNYLLRAMGQFPQQGDVGPWRVHQNYLRDWFTLKFSKVEDKYLRFSS